MVRDWLESRKPPPPPNLAERLVVALAAAPTDSRRSRSRPPATGLPEALISAAEVILRGIASRQPGDAGEYSAAIDADRPVRTTAIDLLAADALITYSLEAAADHHESYPATTDAIIARLTRPVGERSRD